NGDKDILALDFCSNEKVYGSPYLGPTLWERDELYSADSLLKQLSTCTPTPIDNPVDINHMKTLMMEIDELLCDADSDLEPLNTFDPASEISSHEENLLAIDTSTAVNSPSTSSNY
ncbi:unnamed protein product, partial [Didymodactylos carnosus]